MPFSLRLGAVGAYTRTPSVWLKKQDKLSNLPRILKTFKGRELDMYGALEQKYGKDIERPPGFERPGKAAAAPAPAKKPGSMRGRGGGRKRRKSRRKSRRNCF